MPDTQMPRLAISCAITRDGYLDDRSPIRRMISSASDLAAMLEYRAGFDMIVVGAETLRRDNPSLATRGDKCFALRKAQGRARHPDKLVVTRSGDLVEDGRFFQTGDGEKIVMQNPPDLVEALLNAAQIRGHRDLLVEGGASVIAQVLASGRAAEWRLAVSNLQLNAQGGAKLESAEVLLARYPSKCMEHFGDTTTYTLDLKEVRMRELMTRAFDLSSNCPPSNSAFAVGAIACNENLEILSTGYSRETGPHDHAEEAMLTKLDGKIPHTVFCTLEPCLHRASKPTGCAARLVAAGVRRVIFAVAEDRTFTRQTGLAHLADHGVELRRLSGFEDAFRDVNAPIYAR